MIDGREDQASGLRRLFRQTPPAVVALYATGRWAAHNALRAAHRIAGQRQRVLVLDEAGGSEALAPLMRLAPGPDLLQMLDGRLTLSDLVQPIPGLLGLVPTAAAALALPLLDDARRACLIEAIKVLHRHAGFVLIHAGRDSASDPSPFVLAAPQRLLVAEASASGATEAYLTIKHLAMAGAGSLHVAVTRARNQADSADFFASLQVLVRRHVGVPLVWLGEVERDDIAAGLTRTPSSFLAPATSGDASPAFLPRFGGMGAWRASPA